MRTASILLTVVLACLAGACQRGSNATSTDTHAFLPIATTAGATATGTNAPGAAAPSPPSVLATPPSSRQKCSDLVSNADVDALALHHLGLSADNAVSMSGSTLQFRCQFQEGGANAPLAILILATSYADVASARTAAANERATAQAQHTTVTRHQASRTKRTASSMQR